MAHTVQSQPTATPDVTHSAREPLTGILWCAAIACVAGTISWLSVDVLAWPREQFLVLYASAGLALSMVFWTKQRVDVKVNPWRTLVVILITSALMIGTVMLQPGAPRSHGSRLAFELVWDGLVYGAVDGILLTVVPITAMQRALAGGRFSSDALALLGSLVVFVVYHLGFPEFRGSSVVAPIVAGLVFGAAYLISRNPVAPVIAHALMHVAAVLHGPAGTVQLPPHY